MIIRKILETDNRSLGDLIQQVLTEMNAPKIGTAYADPFLFNLFEVYNAPKSIYFVIEKEGKIIGGAGIGSLENNICELQKMYFLPECRGLGFGKQLIELCLNEAISLGYKACYIETLPNMIAAQKLYNKVGFKNINAPIGNTGHNSCTVWMLKELITS